jgi:NDP-sugar pyrophosphorylase family protein
MKIDKVIFTTSEEYSDFWNINSKVHKEYLGIEPICYLFGKKENTNMNEDFGPVYEISYDERFNWLLQLTWYKFWVAQYYPNDVIMIGDIDNIPLQRNWFIDDIEDYSDDCYVHLNAEGIGDQWVAKGGNLTGGTDLPGHYHVAKGTTYKKSLKNAYEYILNDEEVLVSYCDLYIKWNFQEFIDYINSVKCDGLLVSHNNWHPHRIHNKSFAYMLTDRYNNVYKIMEKDYFIDPLKEPASSGIYYFKSGAVLKKYCDMLLKRGIKTNNEFYLTLPYNLMIEDGLVVKHYVHRYYFCFGTPRDVELIKGCYYLLKHLGQQQFYNSDVIQCMSYFENIINDV